MEHLFVKYDIAKLLLEFAFNEPCQARFNKGKQFQHNVLGHWYNHNADEISNAYISAPLYQQVQEWFRTKYFMDITIKYECNVNEVVGMYGNINFMINEFRYRDIKVEINDWVSHNELLHLTFKKAFEFLKQNKAENICNPHTL